LTVSFFYAAALEAMAGALPPNTRLPAQYYHSVTIYIVIKGSLCASMVIFVHQSAYSDGLFDRKPLDYRTMFVLAALSKRDYSIL
jgi:hypothetical protein